MAQNITSVPQSAFEAMHFVDKATAPQLKAMVDANNPFSYMALAKLQSLRDAAMRQNAYKQIPPPLSQKIPQDLTGASPQPQANFSQVPVVSGLSPAMVGAEPPAPEQNPVGIAAIGGNPTGASGGMVAFEVGGKVRRFGEPDSKEQLVTEAEEYYANKPSLLYRQPTRRPAKISEISELQPLKEAPSINEYGEQYTPLPAGNVQPEQPEVSQPSKDKNVQADADVAKNVLPQDKFAPLVVHGRVAPSGIAKITSPSVASNAEFAKVESKLGELKGLTGQSAARSAAIGDVNAETLSGIASLKQAIPDRLSKFEKDFESDRADIKNDREQAVNKSLMVLAAGLMNPTVRAGQGLSGFLASAGEAIPKGLNEFEKLKTAANERLQKQKQLELTLATTQDARDRGMYDIAKRGAEHAQTIRLGLLKADNDVLSSSILAQAQLGMHKAEMPYKEAQLKLKEMEVNIHALQAAKPSALQESVNFANMYSKRFGIPVQDVLNQVIPGLAKDSHESTARALATASLGKTNPNTGMEYTQEERRDAILQNYPQFLSMLKGIKPDGKNDTNGKLVTIDGKMIWQQK